MPGLWVGGCPLGNRGGRVGAARGSRWGVHAWAESRGVEFVGGFCGR
jgi:hypothetical protein